MPAAGDEAPARDGAGPAADREVVVVAARRAWGLYRRCGGYVCQERRSLGGATHMAFYLDKQVQSSVAEILHVEPSVPRTLVEAERRRASPDPRQQRVGEVLAVAIEEDGPASGEASQVVVLSPVDDPRTVDAGGVRHEGPRGWVRAQRYTTLDALRSATTTDDLTPAPVRASARAPV